jgi:hypothetical protein
MLNRPQRVVNVGLKCLTFVGDNAPPEGDEFVGDNVTPEGGTSRFRLNLLSLPLFRWGSRGGRRVPVGRQVESSPQELNNVPYEPVVHGKVAMNLGLLVSRAVLSEERGAFRLTHTEATGTVMV